MDGVEKQRQSAESRKEIHLLQNEKSRRITTGFFMACKVLSDAIP